MKRLFPLAVIGAAIGATGYLVNKKNKDHVEKTLDALDDISKSAEEAVAELAEEISNGEEA